MISKQPDIPPSPRKNARHSERNRQVTVQLNEFINFSRPREVRRSVLDLGAAIKEVSQALGYDLEEKKIRLEIQGEAFSIERTNNFCGRHSSICS